MKVRSRKKTQHLYTNHLQRGGLAVYRGERLRGGRFSLRFLAPIGKFLGKTALSIGKKIVKKAAPKLVSTAIESGEEYLSGKTNLKGALKHGLSKGKKQLGETTRAALIRELEGHQKGSGGLVSKWRGAIYPSKHSWY